MNFPPGSLTACYLCSQAGLAGAGELWGAPAALPAPSQCLSNPASEMEILPFDPTGNSQVNDISQPSGSLPAEVVVDGGSLTTGLGQDFWSVQEKLKYFSMGL